jgi:hypothetical protein
MNVTEIMLERPMQAADQNPLDRPGVPQESDPPQPLADAHWLKPEPQRSERPPLVGKGRELTPVFATANPPRGLSGLVRRLAYRVPDYKSRRWMLLMLGDRIDVLEHNPRRLLKLSLGLGLLAAGIWGATRVRRA